MKWVPDVANLKSCFNSRFVTLSCGLFSKISLTAISIVSCKGILAKRRHMKLKNYHYCLPVAFLH